MGNTDGVGVPESHKERIETEVNNKKILTPE